MDTNITGKIIAHKRKEKGLNQVQLGELLNVSNRTISKWEKGDGLPDISILPELAKALDITIDELLTGERPPVKEVLIEKRDTNKLVRNFRSCYIISLFFALFGALLGSITELYSIWAFNILFYTHWEIMFVAVSLFAIAASGLVYTLGLNNLHFEYSKKELAILAGRKTITLSAIIAAFPLTFIARIVDVSRLWRYTGAVLIFFAIALAVSIFISLKILGDKINERNKKSEFKETENDKENDN